MKQKQIIDIVSVDNFNESINLIKNAKGSQDYELIGFEVKKIPIKEGKTIIDYEYIVKLYKNYEQEVEI